jgi:hypothetical protein
MKKFRRRLRKLEELLGIKLGLPQPIMFVSYEVPGLPEAVSGAIDDQDSGRIERKPGESLEEFKERLVSLPHKPAKFARTIYLFPPLDRPNQAA